MSKNKYITRCPICGTGMDEESYQLDYGITCESKETCPRCGFIDEFTYGGYRMGFELDFHESDYNLCWSYHKYPSKRECKKFKNKMNRNVNKSEFLSEECNLDHTEVEIIDNRFNELDDTYINAVEVKFKIKRKGKRKFEDLKVYYRIIKK